MDPSFAHIISQTRQNVEFLISQRQIPAADGHEILAKLPTATAPSSSMAALERQAQNLLITSPHPPGPQATLKPPAVHVRAKALWDFNEHEQNPQDLSFRAGDTIEIIEETNSDWWTGRLNGREGVFPANYVEKLPPQPAPSPYNARDTGSAPSMPSFPSQPVYHPPTGPTGYQSPTGPPSGPYSSGYQPPASGYQPSYQPPSSPPRASYQSPSGPPPASYQPPSGPPQAAYQPPSGPPPASYQPASGPPQQGGQYNSYGGPPSYGGPSSPSSYSGPPPLAPKPSQASSAAAQPPEAPPKKNKFGKLGSIAAQSAAGGLGFGAGSAIGSGVVNAII
ncbi:SH3-domain-containing protein [Mycena sanguinolenta]|uniref:SH3-domain-containing protein n=1 Tax=Mycena sanguinolenta TaxID=230812 RepID=A0A8H6ZGE0_9AGAR|nr:SH3-domain-containing protein [Mycena sanguinolenta]